MTITEQTQAPDVVDQAEDSHKKSPQESFAELKKAKEDLEKELWQARKERELEKQMLAQQQRIQAPVEEEFDFRSLEQEEFPDGKKLVKAFSQIQKNLAKKDQEIMILKTTQELPDFAQIVTAENIEKYIKTDEDNREAVEKAANPLRKVYNLIKKDARYLADNAKVSKDVTISQEQKRVDEKDSKPRHGSIGVRSEAVTAAAKLSNSTMTKEQKTALWKETLAAARR